MKQKLVALISSRKVYALALALAFLFGLPSVKLGLLLDDYLHLSVVSGRIETVAQADDLFSFARGGERVQHAIDDGHYPWWTHPQIRFAFWRPLSTALINFDWLVFGENTALYHLHSIAWYLLLVAGVGALFRRSLPLGAAGAALILFALRGSHSNPLLWLAARNGFVATAPVIWGLVAHLRWREEGWKPGLPLAILGFAVGLLGGEAAISGLCYLAAYELFRKEPLSEKVKGIFPAAFLGLLYIAAHRSLGYGVKFSSTYIDPVNDPLDYARNAPERAIAMIGGDLLSLPVDFWLLAPQLRIVFAGIGVAAVALVFFGIKAAWPTFDERTKTSVKWLALGSALSILPSVATVPGLRALVMPSVGSSALIVLVVRHALRTKGFFVRARGGLLAFTSLTLGLLMWPLQYELWGKIGVKNEQAAHSLDTVPAQGKRWYVVAAPDFVLSAYLPVVRIFHHNPMPEMYRYLSMTPAAHRFTRTSEKSFELSPVDRSFISDPFSGLFRDNRDPMRVGDVVKTPDMKVTVLAADENGPSKVSIELERGLDDPSVVLLTFQGAELKPWVAPPVGTSVVLEKGIGAFD